MDRIRLLIVSDDASSRRGLTAIFSSEDIFDVAGSYSQEEGIEKSIQIQPDVVLLDISEDITEFSRKIKSIKDECPCSMVLALVENEQKISISEIMGQGVDGFVPKGIIRGCLVKAVELACRAGLFCLPSCYKKVVSTAVTERVVKIEDYKGCLNEKNEMLTKREMEILQLMVKNNSNREIATKLFISEPTVKTHVSSILRKLGLNNRAQVIIYSYKHGLVDDSKSAT
ncbi:two-component response regulator [Desulfocucumis palustris]|uniref:Stage 0 sporulation protein A homolog n=1 Tax=Desulfocucumis palustris TaxID=1898651 RepID=A0A2L2XCW4_9FIRM|nr:response regulator transcription factor [Desulfocucumis palustris]GBF33844.1 two-component response regulator [Desulfocucumis palustris]